jgi:pyridoxal phosphate enzyme (YggS family)
MLIDDNIRRVRNRIIEACERRSRRPADVQIIAVSKKQSLETVRAAWASGLTAFGENYVQELVSKKQGLADIPCEWHFIGHLQSNKVKDVAGQVELIHSVDRLDIARKISERTQGRSRQKILIEVNVANEASKSGVAREQLPEMVDGILELEGVQICGLMAMPPLQNEAESNRRFFAETRDLSVRLAARLSFPHSLSTLSMGTSHDYEVAVEEGATMVRLGTVLLGVRK